MNRNYLIFLLLLTIIPLSVNGAWIPAPYQAIIPNPLDAGSNGGELVTMYGSIVMDFRSTNDYVISWAGIFQRPDSNTTFTLTSYNGQSYSGEIGLSSTLIPGNYDLWVSFNSNEVVESIFLFPFINTEAEVGIWGVINATENSTERGILLTYGDYYIDTLGFEAYDIYSDPIGYFTATSTNSDTEIIVGIIPLEGYYVAAVGSWTEEENIIWQIYGVFGSIANFLWQAYTWISFLILNLPMILAIGEVATMFYALTTSSSIFTAIKKWWKFNENTLNFFVKFFETMLNIVRQIVSSIPILGYLWK